MENKCGLFIFFIVLYNFTALSKSIYEDVCVGDVVLFSQAEVDAFRCTEVVGSLSLIGSDITNLTGLSSLRKVSSNLSIGGTNVKTLDGLSSLEFVGGELGVYSNDSLIDVTILNSLKHAGGLNIYLNIMLPSLPEFLSLNQVKGGGIYIGHNPALSVIKGFETLTSIDSNVSVRIFENEILKSVKAFNNVIFSGLIDIENNPALEDIDMSFTSLEGVNGIVISGNNELTSIDGFLSLTELKGQLNISNNASLKFINGFKKLIKILNNFFQSGILMDNNPLLESFDGLSSLAEISGKHAAVSINKNPSLRNLKGLSSLVAVNGTESQYLHINTNIRLEDIDGLSSLRPPISGSPFYIVITQNEKLIRCGGLLPYLEALGWDEVARQNADKIIRITDNGSGCTLGDLINGGPVAPSCSGEVVLYSQSKVDAFSCPIVNGNLTIAGADITNLNTLSALRKVTHVLNVFDNPLLTSLESLSALDTIGSLNISNNASLTDLSGFSSLRLIEHSQNMSITNNSSLKSISGFNNLIKGVPMTISRNPNLVSITGFNSLVSTEYFGHNIPANLIIEENESLAMIEGFSALKVIGDIRITNNNSMLSLSGFSSLTSIVGSLEITNNESLKTVDAFKNLLSLGSFPQVGVTSSGLYISGNSSLESIDGLSSLKSVAGTDVTIGITFNPFLKDIDWLSSLTTINGVERASLMISNNNQLENLDGLSLLVPSDGTLSIKVVENSSLIRCRGLFPYLVGLGFDEVLRLDSAGTINIKDNGAGCTVQDIIAAGGQLVTKFSVVDKRTHELVKSFENDSVTLDLSNPDFIHWALQAHTFPTQVGSVEFVFDSKHNILTNQSPYSVSLSLLDTGIHTIVSNVFTEPSGGGEKGTGKSGIIAVIRSSEQDCIDDLSAEPDVTSVKLHWPPYGGSKVVGEYRVKRNGVDIGGTVGKYGYFTDVRLTPGTSYTYAVEIVFSDGTLCLSDQVAVTTTTHTSIRTHYKLLAIVFDPDGQSQGELEHIRTFLKYRLDFLKNASHNAVNLEVYSNDIISIDAYPPREEGTTNIDYATLALTAFSELGNNTMVDLIEKYDVDIVWVLGAPFGYDFGENALMGNKNLGADTWISTKVKCSRSFFIHSNSGDARAFDAAAHHIEGMMTSATEGSPDNWPRDKEFLVYRANRNDFSMYTTSLHLWGRFRLTDEWNGVYGTEGHMSNAYASKGNSSCGSSHFVPGSIRNSTTYDDYTYYDIDAWKRYVDSYADDWLSYPNFSDNSRKLNGYDFGAFNNYGENSSNSSFGFGTASFHYWWFNHIPHNPGVSNGKLNNWWPYLYDSDRFDGSAIQYEVDGFPVVPLTYSTTNNEYGTEETTPEHNWMFWHTNTDFGQRADVSIVSNTTSPEFVKSGQSAMRVHVQLESFGINGRNDLIYPRYRNAHWNLSDIDTVTFSVKFVEQYLVAGTNPIFRLCTNGNNRIEFVPKKVGLYTNLFEDAAFQESYGWYTFRIPVSGSTLWEQNVIGYIDPNLSAAAQQQGKQILIQKILSDVNYFEISVQSNGGRGESLVYAVDDIKFHKRDTTQAPEFSKVIRFDVVDTSGKFLMELSEGSKINKEDPAFKSFSIRAHTNPAIVSHVQFWLNGRFFRVENVPPYAFNGDVNGVYNPWVVDPWDYRIKAVPYIRVGGKEYAGAPLEIHFKVVSEKLNFAVVGYDIVDTSGKFIQHLNEGDAISIDQPMTVIANTTGQVGSVKFILNNQFYRTENVPPYTITGDQNGYFNPWVPQSGNYTLTGTPFSSTSAGGEAGKSFTIHFVVGNGKANAAARSVTGDLESDTQINSRTAGLSVYPVPVEHELHLSLNDELGQSVLVTITNAQGLGVYKGSYSNSKSINTIHFNSGVYFLHVIDQQGDQKVIKFIKK